MPSGFTAKDARPKLLHSKIYKKEETIYIKNGVPLYPAYYTPAPIFQDHLYKALYMNSIPIKTPVVVNNDYPMSRTSTTPFEVNFKKLQLGRSEKISDEDREAFTKLLTQLSQRPDAADFESFLSRYRATPNRREHRFSTAIESPGSVRNLGFRKAAIADVVVTKGTGKFFVNGRELTDYFTNPINRETAMSAFYEIQDTSYDTEANVIGGGLSGQAGAIRHAIALCLATFSKDLEAVLKNAKYLFKDNRISERKKYARHSARKRYTWVPR